MRASPLPKAQPVKFEKLAYYFLAATLLYWVLMPSGLLLPLFWGFESNNDGLHTVIGMALLIVATIALRPSLPFLLPLPKWQSALIAVFALFLIVAILNPINSRVFIYFSYIVNLFAIASGLSMALLVRKIGPETARMFVTAFCASFLVYAVFWLITMEDMIAVAGDNWAFAFWPFGNIRTVGIFFMPAIIGALAYGATPEKTLQSWFFLATATLGMTFLLWTGSRGPLMAIFLAAGLVAILQPSPRRRQFILAFVVITAIASLFSLGLPRMNGSYGFWQRIFELSSSAEPNVLSDRGGVWVYTLEKILARPLTGYGWGSYLSHPDALIEWRRHAHNDILQLWHDFGLIGGSAAIGIVVAVVFKSFAAKPAYDESFLACIGMTASMLCVAMVDTVIVYIGNFTFLCLILGLLSGVVQANRTRDNP